MAWRPNRDPERVAEERAEDEERGYSDDWTIGQDRYEQELEAWGPQT